MSATDPMPAPEQDIRPFVARTPGRRAVFLFAAILAVVAGALFAALETRRAQISSPSVLTPAPATSGMIASPPDLAIPPANFQYDRGYPDYSQHTSPLSAPSSPEQVPMRVPREASATYEASPGVPSGGNPAQEPAQETPQAGIFAYQPSALPPLPIAKSEEDTGGSGRARARQLRNPSTTVEQGTVIQAVLETALDSTRAGFARALVSRDVRGFDGSQILIPRGSRLFGEYAADVSLGQKRALIQWRRLTRPDGVIIDLNSPSADPLGRAGIKGKVNSHFFQRFSGAILQSILDIGVGLATREVSGDTLVLAIPGGAQSVPIQKPEDIKPTLKVRHGSSVSVVVARDLDFSAIGD